MSEKLAAASHDQGDIFKIVTPAYNAASFIEETLISVVSQVTRGTLYYHIQDGGSTDGTLDILRHWDHRLKQGRFAASSVSLHFSFASEPDAGMYDAVNTGFHFLDVAPSDILTWINADDRLPQGALVTVAQVLRDVPDCRFLSGRVSILTAEGEITGVNAAGLYGQADLAAGRHDGRSLPFIMQEGTFFLGAVWLEAGGANTKYRLAGDWDLWRRIARREQHYSLDSITGFHRRRPGQLSEDMARYYAEVSAGIEAPTQDVLAQEGNLIRFQADQGAWRSVKVDPFAVYPFELVAKGVLEAAVPWRYAEGFGPPEGPYPEHNLPANVRWITHSRGRLQIEAPVVGRYTVRARMRASQRRPLIRFFVGLRMVCERELVAPRAMVDSIIEFSCWLEKGCNIVSIEASDGDRYAPLSRSNEPLLLIISLEFATDRALTHQEIARRRSASDGSRGCRNVAFIVRSVAHAEKLDATLASLVDAGAGRHSIFIENDGDPLTDELARRFEPHVEEVVEQETVSDEGLRNSGFELRLDLVAGDQLILGSLEVARSAMSGRRLDVISGLIDGFDCLGRLTSRIIDSHSKLHHLVKNAGSQSSVMGFPLFLRNNANVAEPTGAAPRVMLHEASRPGTRLPMLLGVAKGFALLGCETFLVHAQENAITLQCGDQSLRGQIVLDEVKTRLTLEGLSEITCPAGHDSDAFQYITRRQARRLFGVGLEVLIVAVFVTPEEAAKRVFLNFVSQLQQSRRVGIILCSGEIWYPELERFILADVRETLDARLEPYVLAAADVVFHFGFSSERISNAGAMAWTPVVRSEEATVDFVHHSILHQCFLEDKRNHVVAWQSHEAFALSFKEQALRVLPEGALSHWLARRETLATGRVELRTDDTGLLNAKASCSLTPIIGAQREMFISQESFEEGIVCLSPHAVFALEVRESDVQAFHLRVRTNRSGKLKLCVDGLHQKEFPLNAGSIQDLRFDALLAMGTHCLEIGSGTDGLSIITILEFEVVASAASGSRLVKDRPSVVFTPCLGRETENLCEHGDWQRLDGFHGSEDPHPQFGLHEEFRWSQQSFRIAIWSECDCEASLSVAVRGNHPGQKLSVEIAGDSYGWCEPLFGNLVFREKLNWTIRLKRGANKLKFYTSSTTGNIEERVLGIILESVNL